MIDTVPILFLWCLRDVLPPGSQCDLEYPSTMEEKDRIQAARERVQADSDALLPVLSVMYSQLQLLQSVQECLEVHMYVCVYQLSR